MKNLLKAYLSIYKSHPDFASSLLLHAQLRKRLHTFPFCNRCTTVCTRHHLDHPRFPGEKSCLPCLKKKMGPFSQKGNLSAKKDIGFNKRRFIFVKRTVDVRQLNPQLENLLYVANLAKANSFSTGELCENCTC